jgi:hypothetical protein
MADKFCSNCGAKNKPNAVVCQKCNTAFPSASQSGSTPVVVVQHRWGEYEESQDSCSPDYRHRSSGVSRG